MLSVAIKCSTSCGHSRTQLRDIHHSNLAGKRVKGHLISVLVRLATELTPATAAQSSLARTSQIAMPACKEAGNTVLYVPEKRREQDIDELVMIPTCPKCRVNTLMI